MESTQAAVSASTPAVDPRTPPSPTITFYQQLAAQLSASVTQTIEQIPGYHDDLSGLAKKARRQVTSDFISMTVTAVEASEELTGVKQLDPVQTRDSEQFSDAFQPLSDLLISVARRLDLMIKAKDLKAGRGALAIYSIAQRLAKNPNNTHLAVHVANLKAELKRKRPSKKPKATPPTSPPSSPVTPAAAEEKKGGDTAK